MGVYPANRILVVPSNTLPTVNAAIDFAVAAGADYDNQFMIYLLPDAALEWDEPLPAGVSIDYTPKQSTPVEIPWDVPLITIMADDCLSSWQVDHADTGGVSPLLYAAQRGVPINMGLIGQDYADTANIPAERVTMANLRLFTRQNLQLYAHSWTHADPTDQQGVLREVVGVRQLIESLKAATLGTPGERNQEIGTLCADYWKWPGNMTGDYLVDSLPKTYKTMARTVVQHYSSSGAYLGIASRQRRHFGTVHYTGAAAVTAVASAPQRNIILMTHGLSQYAGDWTHAQFKTIIDSIVALRTAGAAYPVTLDTWFAARPLPRADLVSTDLARRYAHSNLVDGIVDNKADGALTTAPNVNGWYASAAGASVVDLGAGVKCFEIANGAVSCMVQHLISPERGRKYSVSFLARRTPGGGAGNQFRVILRCPFRTVAGAVAYDTMNLLGGNTTLPDSDDWVRYWYCIEVPTWAQINYGADLWIGSPSATATKLQFRDILVARM